MSLMTWMTGVFGVLAAASTAVLVAAAWPAPARPLHRTIEQQLARPYLTDRDPLPPPPLYVAERTPRLGGWIAQAIGAEESWQRLAAANAHAEGYAHQLEQFTEQLVDRLAKHGDDVPALPWRADVVLDETEAGAR